MLTACLVSINTIEWPTMQHSICSELHLEEVLNSKRLPFTFRIKTRNTDLQLSNESRKIHSVKGRAMIEKISGIQKLLDADIAHDMATVLTEPNRRCSPPFRRVKAVPSVQTHLLKISVLSNWPTSKAFTDSLALSIRNPSKVSRLITHPEWRLHN